MKKGEESYAEKYLEYLGKSDRPDDDTWNDFFDWAGLPMEQRSDFIIAAILKQAQEIIQEVDHVST